MNQFVDLRKPLNEGIELWKKFSNTPINNNDEIDTDFDTPYAYFDKGTNRFEVWEWFIETFKDFDINKAVNGETE